MRNYVKQPLFWGWTIALLFAVEVILAAVQGSMERVTIALFGLIAASLILAAITLRRRRIIYPGDRSDRLHKA